MGPVQTHASQSFSNEKEKTNPPCPFSLENQEPSSRQTMAYAESRKNMINYVFMIYPYHSFTNENNSNNNHNN